MEDSAISSGVTGNQRLMVGVWIEPVTAHVMITFRAISTPAVRLQPAHLPVPDVPV
jgi:hypothetical protein